MTFDFKGRKILVTGAGRGIGRSLVVEITKAGGQVFGLSRQQEHLDSLVAECPSVIPIQADLGDGDATRAKIEELPVLDGLVNNAAISVGWGEPSVDVSKEDVEKTMNVNVLGALNVTQVVAKKMMTASRGSIVNVSSIAGLRPMRECMAYNLSKAALDMMTRQFALELGPNNIRVNSVNPTVVYTDMGKIHWGQGPKAVKLRGHTPLGRFSEVHEVVGPVVYLLSDVSSMVTGTMNPIEGGLLSNISV